MHPTPPSSDPGHGGAAHVSPPATDIPDFQATHEFRDVFRRFAARTSIIVGSPWTFVIAVLTIIAWAITGPVFHYSEPWQLLINTGTTIVTFLMVFIIQNTQNRDARATHLKLDELIHRTRHARNRLVDLEECTEDELDALESEFRRVRAKAAHRRDTHEKRPPGD